MKKSDILIEIKNTEKERERLLKKIIRYQEKIIEIEQERERLSGVRWDYIQLLRRTHE